MPRRPGLVLGVVGVLGALPFVTLWLGGNSFAQRTAGNNVVSIKSLTTPVLSSRRAAQNIVDEISQEELAQDLSGLAEKLPGKACLQVARGNSAVYEKRTDLLLIPAVARPWPKTAVSSGRDSSDTSKEHVKRLSRDNPEPSFRT